MTELIKPVLTPEEWRDSHSLLETMAPSEVRLSPPELSALIALANAALPDDDPRKITHAWVGTIRRAAEDIESDAPEGAGDPDRQAELCAIADALESYLPPR